MVGIKVSEEETGRLDVYVPGGKENKVVTRFRFMHGSGKKDFRIFSQVC